ncbi:MAG TPA: glycoside hydrolase family 43 protein [Pyrinomonadaceae bacterium]|jgi:arabinan endo-1,5-alpha-L-arabinosidase|nr:glycoside hydrolase family 43 protein [Pyrinomonadaceae bacterium]
MKHTLRDNIRLERKILCAWLVACCVLSGALVTTAQEETRRENPASLAAQGRAARTYTNPVHDEDFPDPTVIRASDGFFYAYATQATVAGKVINIQVARSRELVRWELLGDALAVKPAWANQTQKFWAPHVSQHGDTFYMYYSADPNTLTGLCLAVATAKNPQGPFTDIGKPLKCGASFVNIDPMAFDDPRTGKRLLYWGSGFEPIRVQELAADRVSFKPGSAAREVVFPVKAEDPANYQRLIEGAWVTYRAGFYYLFFSGDNCCGDKAHYAVMVARSRSALGPFETLAAATGEPQSVVLELNTRFIAPGHNSVIRDAAGDDWLVYHAIDTGKRNMAAIEGDRDVRRIMLLDRLVYRRGWPRVEWGSPSTLAKRAPNVGTVR